MDPLNRRTHRIIKLDATATSAIVEPARPFGDTEISPSLSELVAKADNGLGAAVTPKEAIFSWVHH
jgi:hypothetical protein